MRSRVGCSIREGSTKAPSGTQADGRILGKPYLIMQPQAVLGLLLGVMVTSANVGDHAVAQVLLYQVADGHHLLALIWADGRYTGSLDDY
jgi:hypothetical protein